MTPPGLHWADVFDPSKRANDPALAYEHLVRCYLWLNVDRIMACPVPDWPFDPRMMPSWTLKIHERVRIERQTWNYAPNLRRDCEALTDEYLMNVKRKLYRMGRAERAELRRKNERRERLASARRSRDKANYLGLLLTHREAIAALFGAGNASDMLRISRTRASQLRQRAQRLLKGLNAQEIFVELRRAA